ncbi:(deoxy)nucleoside triphosphate pyrophosphohydrolase [Gordonia sp. PDNC005]|uniref:(deoxy)nucleoside triphosphate pyrophosphohydrolase n=1 Tax=unclassified Gordonia (in: high G+C Gram-positive bacteria) TaxID=2657482 RepID=UPI0019653E47|nr:(deoxy)nucleoside triphosphate pyrophosphohydrolase [Gordonia sp. PDNC005]QRY61220.1 (deoxy)nucleoside triphosphate pyrophosphohydrolase [Gordonia sp. PDNC005]
MSAVLVVAGAVFANGRLLLAQRSYPPELAGLWELPGGKVESGETRAGALVRELCEELNVAVSVGEELDAVVRPRVGLELVAIRARIVSGEPVAVEHRALRWVDADELIELDEAGAVVPNDRVWIPELVSDLLIEQQ